MQEVQKGAREGERGCRKFRKEQERVRGDAGSSERSKRG